MGQGGLSVFLLRHMVTLTSSIDIPCTVVFTRTEEVGADVNPDFQF